MHTTYHRDDPLVTGVLTRWDSQGLEGSPWPFVAMCSLSRLQQVLSRALDVELKRFQINRTGFFVLTTLALITGRCSSLGVLSKLLNVHPTTVKLCVDQLEGLGLATRHPHPTDRRTTLVRLTDAGVECARTVNKAVSEAEAGALHEVAPHLPAMVAALQPPRFAVGDADGHDLGDIDLSDLVCTDGDPVCSSPSESA